MRNADYWRKLSRIFFHGRSNFPNSALLSGRHGIDMGSIPGCAYRWRQVLLCNSVKLCTKRPVLTKVSGETKIAHISNLSVYSKVNLKYNVLNAQTEALDYYVS